MGDWRYVFNISNYLHFMLSSYHRMPHVAFLNVKPHLGETHTTYAIFEILASQSHDHPILQECHIILTQKFPSYDLSTSHFGIASQYFNFHLTILWFGI